VSYRFGRLIEWNTGLADAYGCGINGLRRLAHLAPAPNERALEELFRAEYSAVWRLCAALVDEPSADDLAQETFARAIRALGQFRCEALARTWLLSIARHICLDEIRFRDRRRRRDSSLMLVAAIGPGRTAVEPDVSEEGAVVDLIACLDPERRDAFVLTQLLGFSYAEAAQICECPLGTIRSRVARARSDLLELIKADNDRLVAGSGA
jgi:RNA polymerase sigma-70 factor, ECF subfamily